MSLVSEHKTLLAPQTTNSHLSLRIRQPASWQHHFEMKYKRKLHPTTIITAVTTEIELILSALCWFFGTAELTTITPELLRTSYLVNLLQKLDGDGVVGSDVGRVVGTMVGKVVGT